MAMAVVAAALLAAACSDGTVGGLDDGGVTPDASKRDGGVLCQSKLECGTGQDCVGGKCVDVAGDSGVDASTDGGDNEVPDGGPKSCNVDTDCDTGWKCSATTKTCARPAGKLENDEMDFGNAVFGTPETLSNFVENIGTVDLLVLDFAFDSSTDKNAFSFDKTLLDGKPYKLKPGEKLEIKVTFTVVDASAKIGKLQVTTDGDPSLLEAVMKTSFKGSAEFAIVDDTQTPPKVLWPDPQNPGSMYSLDFKQVGVGQEKTISFVVTNNTVGNAPLAIAGLTVTLNPTYYTAKLIDYADKTTELAAPVYLNPTEMVIVTVTFAPPTKNNNVPGTLEVATNDPDVDNNGSGDAGRAIVALAGVAGFPPGISASTNALDFGEVQIGTIPAPKKTITVRNTADPQSGFPLTVDISLALGSETSFTFDPAQLIIQPGDTKDVTVTFDPATNGAKTNELDLENDDPDPDPAKHPLKVVLTGKGVNPNLAVDPPLTVLDFGEVGVGQTVQQSVTLMNTGDGSLDVLTAVITNNPSPFVLTTDRNIPATLTPSGTPDNKVRLTVTFTPTDTSSYGHSLAVTSTDLDNQALTINLTGKGVEPQAVFDPYTQVDFGQVPMGSTSAEKTVTITNAGYGSLMVDEVSVTQVANRFQITSAPNPLPYGIAHNANVTVKLVYKPDAAVIEDPLQNYLVVKTNDPNTPEKHIGLAGEGLNTSDPTAVILTTGTDMAGTAHTNADLDFINLDMTVGHTITLDGKTASHPNGGAPITDYVWTLISKPAGSAASIQLTGDPWRVQLTPDKAGNYKVGLVVKDQVNKSSPSDELSVNGFAKDTLHIEISWDGKSQANNDCTANLPCNAIPYILGVREMRFMMLALGGPTTCDGLNPTPDWGAEGHPEWSALCTPWGEYAEPQYIVLDDGERSDVLKTYGVSANYLEDRGECVDTSNPPLYACAYCKHMSSTVRATIKVNGVVQGGTINKTLNTAGETANIATITRQYGVFTVTPVP
jgi:hypothetical protein